MLQSFKKVLSIQELSDYLLVDYAAKYWPSHLESGQSPPVGKEVELATDLLTGSRSRLSMWVQLKPGHNTNMPDDPELTLQEEAVMHGLEIAEAFLDLLTDTNAQTRGSAIRLRGSSANTVRLGGKRQRSRRTPWMRIKYGISKRP